MLTSGWFGSIILIIWIFLQYDVNNDTTFNIFNSANVDSAGKKIMNENESIRREIREIEEKISNIIVEQEKGTIGKEIQTTKIKKQPTENKEFYRFVGCFSGALEDFSLNLSGIGFTVESCAIACMGKKYFGFRRGKCLCKNDEDMKNDKSHKKDDKECTNGGRFGYGKVGRSAIYENFVKDRNEFENYPVKNTRMDSETFIAWFAEHGYFERTIERSEYEKSNDLV
eukprot:UN32304